MMPTATREFYRPLNSLSGAMADEYSALIRNGQSNTSLLSQLASAKKVKKTFSHCLDGKKGGGIFAIGEVVEPKIKTTPILDDPTHFNIALESIDVNGDAVKLPTSIFDFIKKQAAIVDSGTTLAYFPDEVYNQLMERMMNIALVFRTVTFTGDEITLLGDLVLSDKLVTYDMENQAIGWTDHDCSSSIKVNDEKSGNVYEVGAQDISSAHYM
ncbi:hypothetical protein L1987_65116 [Smallanthus sonchifolius]|uniref:Uncharacterized protein n=1 Tax=Smallanthus sonchifolius TaxID=185202 RepID=A0ACB9BTK2_9ASTR|nr:hypothetical protein L1987_65116 [Smallanthus sonchifolius]